MTPSNTSIQGTVRQLKEIIASLRGEEHESYKLINDMERLVTEIESKAKSKGHVLPSTPSKLPLTT